MTAQTGSYFEDLKSSADLGRLARRGGVASVVGVYGNGVLQIVGVIVLARLLTPEDFGLAALVIIFSRFAPLLIDCGLTDATTQKGKITRSQVSAVFWLNGGIGFAVATIMAAGSPLIAWLYQDSRLIWITIASALSYVFTGITIQHLSLLRRAMRFVEIAKMQVLSSLAGLVVAIILAKTGFGYWSLVIRQIVSAAFLAAAAWWVCGWRPGRPAFDAEVRSMVAFGTQVLGFTMPYSVARILDRVMLGVFYSPHVVGLYQNAQNMYESAFLAPVAQLHGVGSSGLSKLRSDLPALRQKYQTTLAALAFFIMPTAAIMSVTGQDLVVLLLGEKWRESGVLLSILALRGIVEFIEMSQGWLHVANGTADRWKKSGIVSALVLVIGILAGVPFGALGVTIGIVISCWIIAFPSVFYAGRPLGIGAPLVFRAVGAPLISAIVVVVAGWALQVTVFESYSHLDRLLLSTFACAVLYLGIVVGVFRSVAPLKLVASLLRDFGIGFPRARG